MPYPGSVWHVHNKVDKPVTQKRTTHRSEGTNGHPCFVRQVFN